MAANSPIDTHFPLTRHSRLGGLVLGLLILAVLLFPRPVLAHPLGNFTVNRYSRIEVGEVEVRVRYVVDMAEIPTFQEMTAIDEDRDGRAGQSELDRFAERKSEEIRRNLLLALNGRELALSTEETEITLPPGQADLPTLRLSMLFHAPLPEGWQRSTQQLEYRDFNYENRIGWNELVLRSGPGVAFEEAGLPTQEISNELRAYPEDLLANPPDRRSIRLSFSADAQSPGVSGSLSLNSVRTVTGRAGDRITELITARELSVSILILSFVAAFGFGALHALGPGHGKAVVGAYLVGSKGTAKHALILGLTVTVTHTAGVFTLGLVTVFASHYILPERIYPWLSVTSGIFIVGAGVLLFWSRLRNALFGRKRTEDSGQAHPGHSHTHGHEHADDGHLVAAHSHKPANAIRLRGLLALGISGGLLPCPSALVVLLSAISLGRVGFGLLLVVAFSIGLAAVLTGIGLIIVCAGRLVSRVKVEGPILRFAPVFSAGVIVIVGAVITLQALGQPGLPRL